MSQVTRLEQLLVRIQRNARELASSRASARANGVVFRTDAMAGAMETSTHTDEDVSPAAAAPPEAMPSAAPEMRFERPAETLTQAVERAAASAPGQNRHDVSGFTAAGDPDRASGVDFMDQELASEADKEAEAYDEVVEGRRTPPPESGPQVSYPPKPELPEFDENAPISTPGVAPSVEQFGNTVDLGQAEPRQLDIQEDDDRLESGPPSSKGTDEYEEHLPETHIASVYDESLPAPPDARRELDEHDQREQEREARVSLPPAALEALPPSVEARDQPFGVITRSPVPSDTVAAVFEGGRPAPSRSFLELLDESLELLR